ncbi:MAG: type IV pilus secretin PilQ [Deltaproteobacteria bacterium]|nr:type IV pilus secretin PilQ [Deltaproteobacteria bacterium]MCL5278212.1 type IV pilus secretin PilQ [Deltaproteobacteria bacterium]
MKLKTKILVLNSMMVFLVGACAGAKPVPTANKNSIGNINVADQTDSTILTIEGSIPPVYTIYKMTNPLRVVVDMTNADISALSKSLPINNGVINNIEVKSAKEESGHVVGRIDIGLDKLVDYNAMVQGNNLVVTVSKTASTAQSSNNLLPELPSGGFGETETAMPPPLPEVSPATVSSPTMTPPEATSPQVAEQPPLPEIAPVAGLAPTPEGVEQPLQPETAMQPTEEAMPAEEAPLAPPLPPVAAQPVSTPAVPVVEEQSLQQSAQPQQPIASKIIDLKYSVADNKTVVDFVGNGEIGNYNAFKLNNPPRLVIDVLNVGNLFPTLEMPINTNDVQRVRIGQYPDKVRFVLDTPKEAFPPYTIEKKGNKLVATIGSGVQEQGVVVLPKPEEEIPGAPVPQQISAPTASPVAFSPQSLGMKSMYTGRRISLDFKDADIQDILRLIAEVSNKNIIAGENVTGKITMRMVNVPWDQALDIILQTNNLGMVQVGNIIRIAPLETLRKEQEAQLESKQKQEKLEELITRIIPVNYAKASDLAGQLKSLLTSRGSVNVDTRTNSIIIKDVPKVITESEKLVKALDLQTPEVLIEARIVEASTNFSRQLGVQWGTNYVASPAYGNPTGLSFPNTLGIGGGIIRQNSTSPPTPLAGGSGASGSNYIVNLPAAVGTGAGGSIGFTFGNITNSILLDLQLSAMEQTGEGKIISSPKVTTLDNTQAKIQQGLSIPYQTVSQMGTQTQFIDAVLSLEVTPHITANGSIIMKIKADKNAPDTSILSASGVPSISKKEADTEVLVKNGETTVIGGIYQFNKSTTVSGVPWFYKIPLIGWLFKNTTNTNTTTELLIFITPRIVNQ